MQNADWAQIFAFGHLCHELIESLWVSPGISGHRIGPHPALRRGGPSPILALSSTHHSTSPHQCRVSHKKGMSFVSLGQHPVSPRHQIHGRFKVGIKPNPVIPLFYYPRRFGRIISSWWIASKGPIVVTKSWSKTTHFYLHIQDPGVVWVLSRCRPGAVRVSQIDPALRSVPSSCLAWVICFFWHPPNGLCKSDTHTLGQKI